jgi:hypothetical protein
VSKQFAWRLALVGHPVIVVPTSSCGPIGKEVAATVLLATPLAYCAALLVLGFLAMLWRRQGLTVEIEWVWVAGYAPVLTFVVLVMSYLDPDLFAMALGLASLYLAASVALLARLAVKLRSKWLMRYGPALAIAVLVVPNVAVFFSRRIESWILDFELALLFWGGWVWGAILLVLVLGASIPRHLDAETDT